MSIIKKIIKDSVDDFDWVRNTKVVPIEIDDIPLFYKKKFYITDKLTNIIIGGVDGNLFWLDKHSDDESFVNVFWRVGGNLRSVSYSKKSVLEYFNNLNEYFHWIFV